MIFQLFNHNVTAQIMAGKPVNEVMLFKSLKNAFGYAAYSDLLHGIHGMVKFDVPSAIPPEQVKCEAGDLLIVCFSSQEIRYTIMQNKTMHKDPHYYGTQPFVSPVRQHHVLSAKPTIIPVGKSPYLFSDMFSSAILDSVGSFGVFFQRKVIWNPSQSYFDMNYMIADRLVFNSPSTVSQFKANGRRKTKFTGGINNIVVKKKYSEVEACSNLIDFEYALRNMLIGTPVPIRKIGETPLAKILVAKLSLDTPSEVAQKNVKRRFLEVTRDFVRFQSDSEKKELQKIALPTVVFVDNTEQIPHDHDYCYLFDCVNDCPVF